MSPFRLAACLVAGLFVQSAVAQTPAASAQAEAQVRRMLRDPRIARLQAVVTRAARASGSH